MSARLTPYELILQPLERDAFPAIRVEAEQRGTDPRDRDAFLLLGFAGAALSSLMPDGTPPDALEQYAELLYQGYHFWSSGRRLYVFDDAAAGELLAPIRDLDDWELAAPPACYVQLPYQRAWARVSPEAPYEPVDGVFVVADERRTGHTSRVLLRAQLALGMRRDRPGISLVPYVAELPAAGAAARAERPWRDDAPPFGNAIPGGERHGYHALVTTSELEALVVRAFHQLDTCPSCLEPRPAGSEPGASRLPFVLVHAHGRA